jgi:hypothetical protein
MRVFFSIIRPVLGLWDELTDRFGAAKGDELAKIEQDAEQTIESEFAKLNPQELASLVGSLRERRKLVTTGAAYANEVVATSKQILTFGGAGIGLAAAFSRELATLPPALLAIIASAALFYLNLIALSLYTLFSYLWQARFRYPFLYFNKIGNTMPNFYYSALSPSTPRHTFQTAEEKLVAAELYAKDLEAFLRYMIPTRDAAKPAEDAAAKLWVDGNSRAARDELQQYFLLLSYQGYVNQYEVRLTNQFLYGLVSSAIAAGAFFLVG